MCCCTNTMTNYHLCPGKSLHFGIGVSGCLTLPAISFSLQQIRSLPREIRGSRANDDTAESTGTSIFSQNPVTGFESVLLRSTLLFVKHSDGSTQLQMNLDGYQPANIYNHPGKIILIK